ncbi:uncharacterized protein JCM10292_007361 [Rhodotorula paludigena]|uniref:uncharacterized protein n=1 Tax=Rhodotorula paludigena TaxID=86838 RepID=UPI0031758738
MSALVDSANFDLASTPNQLPPAAPPRPAPAPPQQAIPTAQRARRIHGVQTDVLVQVYADRVLVIVTQLGRIGCMIQVTPPPSALPSLPPPPRPSAASSPSILASLPPPHPSTLLSPLFGVPPSPHLSSLHDLYAAQVGAIVFRRFAAAGDGGAAPERPVVLGIGLKRVEGVDDDEGGVTDGEKHTFEQVMEMVLECLGE